MVSSTLTAHPADDTVIRERIEELGVARTLLGVSPSDMNSKSGGSSGTPLDSYAGLESLAEQAQAIQTSVVSLLPKKEDSSVLAPTKEQQVIPLLQPNHIPEPPLPRTGLDALAALASEEASSTSATRPTTATSAAPSQASLEPYFQASGMITSAPTSSDEEEMPPPPPRQGRRRSASNPEGMEKWDSLNRVRGGGARRHFVLPEAILEEELAEANAAVRERELLKKTELQKQKESKVATEEEKQEETEQDAKCEEKEDEEDEEEEVVVEEVDESMLTPEELLRRARSRLLEDLSEGSINGEKGELMLPHALGKYKHVYNQNGRIGIYTPAERAAIVARFNAKRQRRVWNKKIRYNCRKSLADRRLRVKGRFVKRSEQEQLAREIQARVEQKVADDCAATPEKENEQEDKDVDMPDVTDPEAGFTPTEDQPYRRPRRYTIT